MQGSVLHQAAEGAVGDAAVGTRPRDPGRLGAGENEASQLHLHTVKFGGILTSEGLLFTFGVSHMLKEIKVYFPMGTRNNIIPFSLLCFFSLLSLIFLISTLKMCRRGHTEFERGWQWFGS